MPISGVRALEGEDVHGDGSALKSRRLRAKKGACIVRGGQRWGERQVTGLQ